MAGQATRVRQADAAGIADAVASLRAGGLVALPTETVYGLAADARQPDAVAAIYAAKGRPSFNPLIVHLADFAAADRLVAVNPDARALAERFWPGPLTLVLPTRPNTGIAPAVSAGLPTLAVRVPAHPVMRAVLAGFGGPLAAPSANASGRISPTTAAHVLATLGGRVPLILDGGPCATGLESTIVGWTEDGRPQLLRPGAIPAEALGLYLAAAGPEITAPGQAAQHYSPAKPLRLDAATASPDEFHIGFGPVTGDLNLSLAADLAEAAASLYAALHTADASDRAGIAVAPISATGLGAAIADRLRRAATR